MKLWTIHSINAWEDLQQTGVLRCREDLIDTPEVFIPAYSWLSEQLVEKIGPPPTGVQYPVWFYQQWRPGKSKPDLRIIRHYWDWRGSAYVRLECELPDDSVVLLDNDMWHNVLNVWPNCWSGDEYIAFKERYPSTHGSVQSAECLAAIKATWKTIFELDRPNSWMESGDRSTRHIEAVAWELRLDQVLKVDYFQTVARGDEKS